MIVEPTQCRPTLPLFSTNACTEGGLVEGGLVEGGLVEGGLVGGGLVGGGLVGGGLVGGGLVGAGLVAGGLVEGGGGGVIAGEGDVVVGDGAAVTVTTPRFDADTGVAATPAVPLGVGVGSTVVVGPAVAAAEARVVTGVGRVVPAPNRGTRATATVVGTKEGTVVDEVVRGFVAIAAAAGAIVVIVGEIVLGVDATEDGSTSLITKSGSSASG